MGETKVQGVPAYKSIYLMGCIAYFLNYLGRYNFAAAMVVIGKVEGFTSGQLGLVVSSLFFAYGAGQLVSGVLGDKLPPQYLIGAGLGGSALANLMMGLSHSLGMMQAAWLINGLACSLIWAPMVRLLDICMPPQKLKGSLLTFQYAVALGTCCTYVLTSMLVDHIPWRSLFLLTSLVIAAAAVMWCLVSLPLCRKLPPPVPQAASPSAEAKPHPGFRSLYIASGLPLLLAVILLMGILKDGVLTWVPDMVADTYGTSASMSIFLSAILPLLNLGGVELVRLMTRRGLDDVQTSAILFAGAAAAMVLLVFTCGLHPLLTVALFALVSACNFGVNSTLISFVPLRYAAYGHTSAMAGVTNAVTYMGSTLSGWGLGMIAQGYGWNATQFTLLGICGGAFLLCAAARPLWRRFIMEHT